MSSSQDSSGIPVAGEIQATLATAVDADVVSQQTATTLSSAPEFDLGIDTDQITTEKATLCVILLDDSGSMETWKESVVECINNNILFELKQAQTRNVILVAVVSLWHGVLLPFTPVKAIEEFPTHKYKPDGEKTPLRRGLRNTLAMGIQKQAELAAASIPSRLLSLTLTDGQENVNDVDLDELKKSVIDIDSRKNNALFGIGFGSEASGELKTIGIKRVTDARDPVGLAEAFNQFSKATSAAAAE